ncbi:endonuclease/exonuclease/phosphatase family protein [Streptomyces griseoviridis]|uniref:Endonuclease/exonuclease/phosphatase n=1 Tax=Streptomyces griseoviridis TaxID=45398 RepID=A0A3Q9KY37_STRGD|nr:endonuclease/exonuclease/phosphatase family protein [Streptomyces griseoviridis]AZS87243.1 endonuclease/exonuclease/phosphatase family protein [Streptomyces griseoviridis]QCN85904.1 endonuclease/exonuclease/phosphatase [Streptomyces griseoviridis]
MSDEIRVVSWNAQGRAHDILAEFAPHVLLRQGLTGADAEGDKALWAEANALGGLVPFMTTLTARRSRRSGVMIDPRLFEVTARTDNDLPWKPICHVQVRRRGLPRTLHLVSAHLTHHDPDLRMLESRRLTVIADRGHTALIGIDAASYPHRTADEISLRLRWDAVEDRVHYQHRTVVDRHGSRVSDTRPSTILTGGRRPVFTDLAHHAGTVLGQDGSLAATASLGRTDQGPPQRTDIAVHTPDLTPALLSLKVIDTQAVREHSDHAVLVARYDLATVDRVLSTAR